MAEINNKALDQIISLLTSLKEHDEQADYSMMTSKELKRICNKSHCASCEICDASDHECNGCVMNNLPIRTANDDDVPVLADEEDDSDYDDDAVYTLTPKGIASVDLVHAGLMESVLDPRFEYFWAEFTKDMEKSGYIKEE